MRKEAALLLLAPKLTDITCRIPHLEHYPTSVSFSFSFFRNLAMSVPYPMCCLPPLPSCRFSLFYPPAACRDNAFSASHTQIQQFATKDNTRDGNFSPVSRKRLCHPDFSNSLPPGLRISLHRWRARRCSTGFVISSNPPAPC